MGHARVLSITDSSFSLVRKMFYCYSLLNPPELNVSFVSEFNDASSNALLRQLIAAEGWNE